MYTVRRFKQPNFNKNFQWSISLEIKRRERYFFRRIEKRKRKGEGNEIEV
jgi:hypothetical protein